MKHAVPHDLGRERARRVAEAAMQSYAVRLARYHPKSDWVSDWRARISFSVKGMTLHGAIQVTTDALEMELDVPLLLRPFRGIAIQVIEDEIRGWIAKEKAGEVDDAVHSEPSRAG
ncbi:MAG: polyhydroxyalkanoic acid system family protein [Deltaproteobacteria bacterium]|nr:polyhydroxyalkanoic acid system family protein [Deltaproteobacteria bacterium]